MLYFDLRVTHLSNSRYRALIQNVEKLASPQKIEFLRCSYLA